MVTLKYCPRLQACALTMAHDMGRVNRVEGDFDAAELEIDLTALDVAFAEEAMMAFTEEGLETLAIGEEGEAVRLLMSLTVRHRIVVSLVLDAIHDKLSEIEEE